MSQEGPSNLMSSVNNSPHCLIKLLDKLRDYLPTRRRSSIGATVKEKQEFAEKMKHLIPGPQILVDYLPHIVEVLQIKPQNRNTDEIMLLEKAFSHYKFFEHYTTKKKYREANIMAKCCKNFTIEFKKKGDIIFKERDYADRMYFVLKGKIKVYQNKTFLEVTENREKFRQAQLAAQIQAAQMAAQLAAEKPETIILTRGVSMAEVPSDIKEMSPQKKPVGSVYHYERSLDPDIPFVTDSKYNVFFDEGVLTIKPIGWIAEGEVFGELALTNRKPRTASLIATEDTILGVFQKKHYDEILFDLENDRITKMMEFFNGSFGVQFNREEVSKMTSIFTKRKTTINGYFFKNGEKADGFYILKKGEVALYNVNEYGKSSSDPKDTVEKKIREFDDQKNPVNKVREGKSKVPYPLQKLIPGQIFGEECLTKLNTRFYDAKAISSNVTAYYCTQARLHRFFLTSPEIYDTITQKAGIWTKWRVDRLDNASDYYTLLLSKTTKSIRPESSIVHRRQIDTIDPFIFITETNQKGKKSPSPSPSPDNKENKEKRSASVCLDRSGVEYKLRADNRARRRGANVIRSYVPRQGEFLSNIEYIVKHNKEILEKIAKKSIHSTSDFNPITGDVLFRKFDKRVLLKDRLYIYKAEEEDYLLNKRNLSHSQPQSKKSPEPSSRKKTPDKSRPGSVQVPATKDAKRMLRERIKLLSSSDRRFTDRASTARESTALDTNRTDRDPLEGSMTIRTILPSREGPRDTREGTREGTRAVTREGIRETKPPSPTATEKFFQTETDLSFRGPSNITNYMIKPMYRSKSRGDIRALRDSKNKDDFSTLAFFSNQNQDKEKDEFKVQNLVLATEPVLERELSESPELSPEKTAPMVKSFTQLLFYPTGKMQSQPDYKKDSRKPDKVSIDKLKFKLLRKKDYKHYASLMKEKDNETYNKLFEKLTAMSKTKNSAMDSPAVEPTMKVMVKSKHSMFRVREREIGDQSTQQATMVFQTTKEVKDGGAVDNTIRLISL